MTRRRKRIIHLKSPEYPYKTLCGHRLGDIEWATRGKECTCKSCKHILKAYK